MKKSKNENKIKTVFNIYEPLVSILNGKFAETCLKRDAYLDKAIFCESGFLRKEVTIPNSDKAKSYIANSLKQLKLKPVNLLLSKETVDLMNKVCKEKNIPRDAFINRIFLLMIATDNILNVLFNDESMRGQLDFVDNYSCSERAFYDRPNVLDTIEEFVAVSPFWRLRMVFEQEFKEFNVNGLYCYAFKKNALNNLPIDYRDLKAESTIGFNTFMSDSEVSKQENHESVISKNTKHDKLLARLRKDKQARRAKAEQRQVEKKEQTPEKSTKTKLVGE